MRSLLLFAAVLCATGSAVSAQECIKGPAPELPDTPEIVALRKEQRELVEQVRQELAIEEERSHFPSGNSKHLAELRELLTEMTHYVDRENASKRINRQTYFEPYCSYYRRFAQKLEEAGSSNFPKVNGKSVYGKVIIQVMIKRDGSIERIRAIEATSKAIEEHAVALIRSLAPYEPIPSEAREDYFELGASYNYFKQ